MRRISIAIVVIHAALNLAHGAAHKNLNIPMNSWQNVYILVVIVLLPLVAGYQIWKRSRSGYVLLFLSMLGALVFGAYYHFVLPGADNVSAQALHAAHSWAHVFQASAMLLAAVELTGVVVGGRALAGLSKSYPKS
ncbi:MAG TPA: hypothetical protein VJT50_05530 [Pyrinomonadaceae bacterium]|nr:hypothetical protein [Pyrinomonadaceae bacterium]